MDIGAWQATVHGVNESWTRLNARARTRTHTHTHKDIQQFLLQTYIVEHQKPTANHTETSRHPKIMIQCLSMYGKMQVSGFTAMIPLISISTIQWQLSCFLILNPPRGAPSELLMWLKAWQWATCWMFTDVAGNILGGPHNYALEIRYLSLPEGQISHSSILTWIFKKGFENSFITRIFSNRWKEEWNIQIYSSKISWGPTVWTFFILGTRSIIERRIRQRICTQRRTATIQGRA